MRAGILTPYVASEFYGVWGDYDVSISIDKNYLVAGTGYLENAAQVGYGYETPGTKVVRPAGRSCCGTWWRRMCMTLCGRPTPTITILCGGCQRAGDQCGL